MNIAYYKELAKLLKKKFFFFFQNTIKNNYNFIIKNFCFCYYFFLCRQSLKIRVLPIKRKLYINLK